MSARKFAMKTDSYFRLWPPDGPTDEARAVLVVLGVTQIRKSRDGSHVVVFEEEFSPVMRKQIENLHWMVNHPCVERGAYFIPGQAGRATGESRRR